MKLKPRDLLLPLLLVSVMASGVTFLSFVFGLAGRWVFVALLAGYLVVGRGRPRIGAAVLASVSLYVGWCLLTIGWSQVQSLSLMKGLALVLVVAATFGGGHHWIAHHKTENGLDFVWPYAVLSLLAGVTGSGGSTTGTDVEIFAGSTVNGNFLGFIVATSMPIVLWRLYKSWPDVRHRVFWLGVTALYLATLYRTASRSSYLICAAAVAGLLIAIGVRKLVLYGLAAAVALALVASVATDATTSFILRNVYKWSANDVLDGGVLMTRLGNTETTGSWVESYDAAVEGGWLGVGYGVSAGVSGDFVGKFTAEGYGREKGNSQLAVVEETGIVGFGLYLVLVVVLMRKLIIGFRRARDREVRIILGLILGTMIGILVQSAFEAWWGSPGAPEFVVFWSLTGAGIALARTATPKDSASTPELVPAKA